MRPLVSDGKGSRKFQKMVGLAKHTGQCAHSSGVRGMSLGSTGRGVWRWVAGVAKKAHVGGEAQDVGRRQRT